MWVVQRFGLTLLNTIAGGVALGAAYAINQNPDLVSPVDGMLLVNNEEDDFIRSKFATYGMARPYEQLKFFKAPYKPGDVCAIGLAGSSGNAHVYIPEQYLKPKTATFEQTYPKLLSSFEYDFPFKTSTLESANQNETFQKERSKFMELETVFPESAEEMDLSIRSACFKLKTDAERTAIIYGATWIAGLTATHQIACWFIRTVNRFPLVPCAFGVGAMVYKSWQIQAECVSYLCDTTESSAALVHQTSAQIRYNLQRKDTLESPQNMLITRFGNDWSVDLLTGGTTRTRSMAKNYLNMHYLASDRDLDSISTPNNTTIDSSKL